MKFTIITRKFRFGFSLLFQWLRNKEVLGISNRTMDGLYIPFLDYDGLPVEEVARELRRLIDDNHLSSFFLFRSSKRGIHAVCFDKMYFLDWIDLMNQTSVDRNYINVPLKYGNKHWNLRINEKEQKPEYIGYVGSKNYLNNKSTSHYEFFLNLYPQMEKAPISSNWDEKQENIYICRYKI